MNSFNLFSNYSSCLPNIAGMGLSMIGQPGMPGGMSYDGIAGMQLAKNLSSILCGAIQSNMSYKAPKTTVNHQANINQNNYLILEKTKQITANLIKSFEINNQEDIDETAIRENNQSISNLENSISGLEAKNEIEKEKIEKQKKEKAFDKADGNALTRASEKCMKDTYDANTNQASCAELHRGFNMFIEEQNPNKKLEYAIKTLEMYDSNKTIFDKKYSDAYKYLTQYINDNEQV